MTNDKTIGTVKGVIFDMDGLMFDTERVAVKTNMEAARYFGYQMTETVAMEIIGLNRVDVDSHFVRHFGENYPYKEVRAYSQELRSTFYKKYGIPVKKGLFELLEHLHKQNKRTAVASSTNYQKVEEYLELANVRKYFDFIIGGDQVKKGKPDPEIFLHACTMLELDRTELLVLEDSKNGILAAHRAGIKVICIPDLVFHTEEILQLTEGVFDCLNDVIPSIR